MGWDSERTVWGRPFPAQGGVGILLGHFLPLTKGYSMSRSLIIGLLVAVSSSSLVAQERGLERAFERGQEMWDHGNYSAALETYLELLRGNEAGRFLKRIALATGELYEVEEVAIDGHAVRFSSGGRLAAFETGSGGSTRTHIISIGTAVQQIAEFPGRGFVFSPSGDRGAYLTLEESEELLQVRAEVDRLIAQRNRRQAFQLRRRAALIEAQLAQVMVRDLRTQSESPLSLDGMLKLEMSFSDDGNTLYLIAGVQTGSDSDDAPLVDVFGLPELAGPPVRLTSDGRPKSGLVALPGNHFLLFTIGNARVAVYDLLSGESRTFDGHSPAYAADALAIAFLSEDGDYTTVNVVTPATGSAPTVVMRSDRPLRAPAISPDGNWVTVQVMPDHDWEIAVVRADGTGERLVSSEIQHDRFPRFLSNDLILAPKGEGRHQRSYLYDIGTSETIKLFHNNTVRTIAPEYEWAASPDAAKVLIVSERDGDTVSPERGVYLVHLDRTVSRQALVKRLEESLAAERDLRARGEAMFAPVRSEISGLTESVSAEKLYSYQAALFDFGSKFITQPGNARAAEYIFNMLESFGYEPEYQWFEPRPGVRSANVIVTLLGTEHQELIYVVSSHFDSVERGPGADDNTSGTAVLLETARVLADHPMAATVKFAFFTGEEAGLLGSREFVRRAVRAGDRIVGALNNDMLGWANSHRLDNTIRYSNAGIRDVQHAAAFLFSHLITYDAKYYKSTDAHAYYEEYGDIVGGIGSYPVLGNPHYHQVTDELETINQDLVRETAKTNIASIALLASSPSRLTGLEAQRGAGGTVAVRWSLSPEVGIESYVVTYGPHHDPTRYTMEVKQPRATIRLTAETAVVAVKAMNARGLSSWDWARTIVVGR